MAENDSVLWKNQLIVHLRPVWVVEEEEWVIFCCMNVFIVFMHLEHLKGHNVTLLSDAALGV